MTRQMLQKLTRNLMSLALAVAVLSSLGCANSPTAPVAAFEDLNTQDLNVPANKLSDDEFDARWHGTGSTAQPVVVIQQREPDELAGEVDAKHAGEQLDVRRLD